LEYDLLSLFISILPFVSFLTTTALVGINIFVFVANVVRPLIFVFIPAFVFSVTQFVAIVAMNVIPVWTVMSVMRSLLAMSTHYLTVFLL